MESTVTLIFASQTSTTRQTLDQASNCVGLSWTYFWYCAPRSIVSSFDTLSHGQQLVFVVIVHTKRSTVLGTPNYNLESKPLRHSREINPYIGEDRKGSIMFIATGSSNKLRQSAEHSAYRALSQFDESLSPFEESTPHAPAVQDTHLSIVDFQTLPRMMMGLRCDIMSNKCTQRMHLRLQRNRSTKILKCQATRYQRSHLVDIIPEQAHGSGSNIYRATRGCETDGVQARTRELAIDQDEQS